MRYLVGLRQALENLSKRFTKHDSDSLVRKLGWNVFKNRTYTVGLMAQSALTAELNREEISKK